MAEVRKEVAGIFWDILPRRIIAWLLVIILGFVIAIFVRTIIYTQHFELGQWQVGWASEKDNDVLIDRVDTEDTGVSFPEQLLDSSNKVDVWGKTYHVKFPKGFFKRTPRVVAALDKVVMSNTSNVRVYVEVEKNSVTPDGFDLRFVIWPDVKINQLSAIWIAAPDPTATDATDR